MNTYPREIYSDRSFANAAQAATELVERIRPLLAEQHPNILGVVLAELTSVWLSGHFVAGNQRQTRKLRATLLNAHYRAVKRLVDLETDVMPPVVQ